MNMAMSDSTIKPPPSSPKITNVSRTRVPSIGRSMTIGVVSLHMVLMASGRAGKVLLQRSHAACTAGDQSHVVESLGVGLVTT
ncbi:hypothetical protein D3C72_1915890 [compost metagenome]